MRDFSVQNVERKWTTPEPKDRTGPKVRWSEELLDEVARWEVRLSLVGCTEMNKQLSYLFPERSLEGIKGMRRLPKYKVRVGSCAEVEARVDTLPVTDWSPPVPGCVSWGASPGEDKDEESSGSEGPPYECGETPQFRHVIPGG